MTGPTRVITIAFIAVVALFIVAGRLGSTVWLRQLWGVKPLPTWLERFMLNRPKR